MNVKSSIMFVAILTAVILVLSDAAPASRAEESELASVLRKANLLLDQLLAKTQAEAKRTQSTQEQDSLEEESRDKKEWQWDYYGHKWVWVVRPERSYEDETPPEDKVRHSIPQPDSDAILSARQTRPERGQDDDVNGPLPYIAKEDVSEISDADDEVSLKDAIRWLQEMREQRKNHVAREHE